MEVSVTPEQQAVLQQLGVTANEFIFYHARRIDGRHVSYSQILSKAS